MVKTALLLLISTSCFAQAQFEVATIKPHPTEGKIGRLGNLARVNGNRVSLGVVTLNELIGAAYDVQDFQILGAPVWATEGTARYDIEAVAPGDGAPTPEQVRQMLQALLAQRFHVSLHRDSKEMKVFQLSIGKGGPKINTAEPGSGRPAAPVQRLPMQTLENILAGKLDRPLVDKTGFSGQVDFQMDFNALDRDQVSIPTLVQESLGLKLEAVKAATPILVIDHAERPSEN